MHRYDHCHKYKHVDVNTFVNHAGTKNKLKRNTILMFRIPVRIPLWLYSLFPTLHKHFIFSFIPTIFSLFGFCVIYMAIEINSHIIIKFRKNDFMLSAS